MMVRRLCRACLDADSARRSSAATGRAGRPKKSPSQLEVELYKFALNSQDAKTLDLWLAVEGYGTERNAALKRWALAAVERERRRKR